MALRIGIDTGLFPPSDHGGLAVYRRELVRALAEQPGDHRLVLFGRNPPLPDARAAERVEIRELAVGPLARLPGFFRQVELPRAARRENLDVMHFPLGGGSLVSATPAVVSVHDLLSVVSSTLDYPVEIRGVRFRMRKRWHRYAIPATLRRARRLIASSQATRDDLVRLLAVPAERISVVPLAVARAFEVRPAQQAIEDLARRAGLGEQWILGLSSIDPRKNAHRLIDAYALLPGSLRAHHTLAIVLTQATHASTLRARAEACGVGDRLRLVPHLSEQDLAAAYAGAAVLAFPSLFEGFGLPVLEAMSLGVPVVASKVGGIPEVGGDAVDYIDPRKPAELAAALERVLTDMPRALAMRERGTVLARRFSWERTAAATLAAYRQALS